MLDRPSQLDKTASKTSNGIFLLKYNLKTALVSLLWESYLKKELWMWILTNKVDVVWYIANPERF